MNFLRPSNRAKAIKPSRLALLTGPVCFALLVVLLGPGCKDEFAPPTLGTLEIRFSNVVPGAYENAQVLISKRSASGDYELERTLTVDQATIHGLEYAPDTQLQIEFEKECASVSPEAIQLITIQAGKASTINWSVDIDGGLVITSSPSGATVLIDGFDTGETTPTTLCEERGTHTIRLELLGAEPVEKVVEITPETTEEDLTLNIVPQTRGAFVEILTAVYCPGCYPVDEAAEELWHDTDRVAQGAISVQMHHPWGGSDVFYTQDTSDRNDLYGAGGGSAGHPIRMVNGVDRAVGAGDGDVDRLAEEIVDAVDPYLGTEAEFSMHWRDLEHVPGNQVSGTLRVFALKDIEEPGNKRVLGMNYKHKLVAFVPTRRQDENFFRVIREINDVGTCESLGLTKLGDWADIEFMFDISQDFERNTTTLWSEDEMGLIGIVQHFPPAGGTAAEVLQVRHQLFP